MVRAHTIESGDLCKKVSALTEHIQRLESTPMHNPTPSQNPKDDTPYDRISMAGILADSSEEGRTKKTANVEPELSQCESLESHSGGVAGTYTSSGRPEKGVANSEGQAVHSPGVHMGHRDQLESSGCPDTKEQKGASSQDDRSLLDESGGDSSCDDQGDFVYEALLSERLRQHSLLRSLTGKIRYRLHCRLMSECFTTLGHGRREGVVSCAGSESTSSTGPSSSSLNTSQSDAGTPNEKRAADDDNENDRRRSSKKRHLSPRNLPTAQTSPRRFACPYHKHEPNLFGVNTRFHGCAGQGFKDIAKLK